MIVSYNTQTFFDAIDDGREFKEFHGAKSRWSKSKYKTRLERLYEVILLAGKSLSQKEQHVPDIVILQEIESQTVLEDFCKQLPRKHSYPYAVCPPAGPSDAFTLAILSRFPIISTRLLQVYTEGVAVRPIIEARLNIGTHSEPIELVLFAVHWKSKAGGGDTASIRKKQEDMLYRQIQRLQTKEPDTPFLICGDFNQTRKEFTVLQTLNNAWDKCGTEPHTAEDPKGTYRYKNEWEDIDHIFYSENLVGGRVLQLGSFDVIADKPLVTSSGNPRKYQVFKGSGYSDHLPLGIVLHRVDFR